MATGSGRNVPCALHDHGRLRNQALQWRDIDFLNHAILVRTSKTDAGERLIPMNDETLEIVMRLRERAKGLNGTEPQHYVFPACEHSHVDPKRNQTSFRTAWRRLTNAAGLAGLRFHDLRHHAITELAESQVSDQTIMAIAGHSQPEDGRSPLARALGSSAASGDGPLRETDGKHTQGEQKRGLRHKPRHKSGGDGYTSAGSD